MLEVISSSWSWRGVMAFLLLGAYESTKADPSLTLTPAEEFVCGAPKLLRSG